MDQEQNIAKAATRKLRDRKRKVRLEIMEDPQRLASRPPDILFIGSPERGLEAIDIAEIEKICVEQYEL